MQRLFFLLVFALIFANVALCKDPYKILGVDKNASEQDIKKAYHKLSLKYHPDKNSAKNANEKFAEISSAYETLSDPEKRKQYDLYGDEPPRDQGYRGNQAGGPRFSQGGPQFSQEGPGGFSFFSSGSGGNFKFEGNEDIFKVFGFGGPGGPGGFGGHGGPGGFGGHGGPGGFRQQQQQEKPVELIKLKSSNFKSRVLDEPETWIVMFQSGAGQDVHVQEFAKKMEGIIKVGFVDCSAQKKLCKQQNISVANRPKIYIYPWVPSGIKKALEYTGDWDVRELEMFSVEFLPRASKRLSEADYQDALEDSSDRPKVVLLSKKSETPPKWRVLSGAFYKNADFFDMKVTDKEILKKFKVRKLPAVVAILADSEATVLSDSGNVNIDELKKLIKDLEAKNKDAIKKKSSNPENIVPKLSKANMEKVCGSRAALCILAISRNSKAEDNAKKILTKISQGNVVSSQVAVTYATVDGSKHAKFGDAFGAPKQDTVLVAYKPRKGKYSMHTGSFSAQEVEAFVVDALNGDRKFEKVKSEPTLSS